SRSPGGRESLALIPRPSLSERGPGPVGRVLRGRGRRPAGGVRRGAAHGRAAVVLAGAPARLPARLPGGRDRQRTLRVRGRPVRRQGERLPEYDGPPGRDRPPAAVTALEVRAAPVPGGRRG